MLQAIGQQMGQQIGREVPVEVTLNNRLNSCCASFNLCFDRIENVLVRVNGTPISGATAQGGCAQPSQFPMAEAVSQIEDKVKKLLVLVDGLERIA